MAGSEAPIFERFGMAVSNGIRAYDSRTRLTTTTLTAQATASCTSSEAMWAVVPQRGGAGGAAGGRCGQRWTRTIRAFSGRFALSPKIAFGAQGRSSFPSFAMSAKFVGRRPRARRSKGEGRVAEERRLCGWRERYCGAGRGREAGRRGGDPPPPRSRLESTCAAPEENATRRRPLQKGVKTCSDSRPMLRESSSRPSARCRAACGVECESEYARVGE